MLTGIASLDLIDANSGQIIDTIDNQINDECWPTIATLLGIGSGWGIDLPGKSVSTGQGYKYWSIAYSPNKITKNLLNMLIPAASYQICIPGYPVYTVATLPGERDVITFIADIPAPAVNTTRTISTLGVFTNGVNFNGWTGICPMTALPLTTPCIQSSSTIVRVTYRIYIDNPIYNKPISNSNQHLLEKIRYILKTAISTSNTYITAYPSNRQVSSSSFGILPTSSFKTLSSPDTTTLLYGDRGLSTSITNSVYTNTFKINNVTLLSSEVNSLGCFFKTLTLGNGAGDASYFGTLSLFQKPVLQPGMSPLQNVFKLLNTAIGPFQDITYIGTMLGNITVDVSGYTYPQLPKIYRIIITQSGDINNATYQYEEMTFIGGFMGNTYSPRSAFLLQDPTTSEAHKYTRKVENEVLTVYPDIKMGSTTFRSPDNDSYVAVANCSRTYPYISMYNVKTSYKSVLDTTKGLDVTNVSDLGVSGGFTFVTCSSTGLWKMAFSVDINNIETVNVTHISIGSLGFAGCYQIDVKDNGVIWVLVEGGLAESSDLGVTWSIYDTSSTVKFVATGITDNKWSNVAGMIIDPVHVDSRILFMLGDNTGNGYVWWSKGQSNPTSDATSPTSVVNPDVFTTLIQQLRRSDNIRCINGRWVENKGPTSAYTNHFSWKATALSTINIRLVTPTQYFRAIPASVNGISGLFSSQTYDGQNTPSVFIPGTALPSLTTDLSVLSSEFSTKFGSNYVTTNARTNGAVPVGSNSTPLVYLPNSNILFCHEIGLNGYSVSPLVIDPSVPNYATYKNACWKRYGWDGASWVLNHNGNKSVNGGLTTLSDGVSVIFSESVGSGIQFINGEHFTFITCNGLMKDNATSYTFNFSYSLYPSKVITSFSGNTIGVLGTLVDEPVGFSLAEPDGVADQNTTALLQNKGYVVGIPYSDASYSLISDQLIPATTNFVLKFKFASMYGGAGNGATKSIGVSSYASGFTYTKQLYANIDLNNNVSIRNGANTELFNITGVTIDTEISIGRSTTDNKLYVLVNGTLVYTTATVHNMQLVVQAKLNVDGSNVYNLGFHGVKLSYIENRNILRVGEINDLSGSYNPKFMNLTTTGLANDTSITVDSVLYSSVHKTAAESFSTLQVKIATGSGWLVFNPEDNGKTVSGNVTALITPDYSF